MPRRLCYNQNMPYYLLTAAGPDKAGIVAAAAEILYELGCNLEDSAMTRLRGEFAILLIFTAPAKTSLTELRRRLQRLEKSHGLTVQLKPMKPRETLEPPRPQRLCLVTVYGADKPGIVYRVTRLLSKNGVNITDVTTHRTAAGTAKGAAGYILYLEGELAGADTDRLQGLLQDLGRELGVTVALKPVDAEPL
ncbi:MAG TPA: ACT domain-containing protein [Elusimicrobiota bacterium]|nr:ACT domain-containing protein [Elusimicrobiota bacterium]